MEIWIIGAGSIGMEYAKVLDNLNLGYNVIGRGLTSAEKFKKETGRNVITGGLRSFLNTKPIIPTKVIIAVGVEELAETIQDVIRYGVKNIFAEKPGFCSLGELETTVAIASEYSANVYLAYNRRFFASTLMAEKIIEEDGGLLSMNFEFTEWSHIIGTLGKSENILNNWFFANSTHVVDLAFFLAGNPKEFSAYTGGNLSWHKPSIFAGSGVTDSSVLFTYQANWEAPGRWGVELLTKKHRIYLKPMETLHIQKIGSVAIEEVELNDSIDKQFKPGFYLQTEAFITGNIERICSLEYQYKIVSSFYKKINGID